LRVEVPELAGRQRVAPLPPVTDASHRRLQEERLEERGTVQRLRHAVHDDAAAAAAAAATSNTF